MKATIRMRQKARKMKDFPLRGFLCLEKTQWMVIKRRLTTKMTRGRSRILRMSRKISSPLSSWKMKKKKGGLGGNCGAKIQNGLDWVWTETNPTRETGPTRENWVRLPGD